MKNNISFAIIASVSCLLFGSCVKDILYHTPHPEQGAVEVTTDWSGRSSEATQPVDYILRVDESEQTVTGEQNVFKSLIAPGAHNLLVYNQVDGITVTGTTATVNTLPDGTLEPMPEYLFSGYQELNVPADDTLRVSVSMLQHIREITLDLNLKEGDELIIAGTSATLSGIASSVDLTTGRISSTEGSYIVPSFEIEMRPLTRASAVPVLTATLRLFGIIPAEKQELSIAVALTNGTVQTIKTDLTDYLKNFGSGELEPLVLDATLSLPPEVGVTATINDWTIVNNGNINIK